MSRKAKKRKPARLVAKSPRTSGKAQRRFEVALQLHRNGDLVGAKAAYQSVLSLQSDHAITLHHLGLLLHQAGDLAGAIEHLQRAVQSDPHDAVGYNNLGNMLAEAGQLMASAQAYRNALASAPDYLNARFNLGAALSKLGQFDDALECFKAVVAVAPADVVAWTSLGSVYLDLGSLTESIQAHTQALALDPNNADAHNALGLANMDNGAFSHAADCYRAALRLAPDHSKAALNLAKVKRYAATDEEDIALIDGVLRRPGLAPSRAADVHFALGKVYDDCGHYERAFRHYRSANELRKRDTSFGREQLRQRVDDTIAAFDAALFEKHAGHGSDNNTLAFIVGMPRSGTTLVEQILASHPAVFGAGELTLIENISRGLRCQDAPAARNWVTGAALDGLQVAALSREYLEQVQPLAGNALRITDKTPGNYYHLGLIALLFPQARIVHCQRNPLDVGLSLYFHQFPHGHEYSYDLADIAFVYRQYRRLMRHWQQVLPIPIHRVCYERLVNDQEGMSRPLLDYLGLDWNEQVLRFFANKRLVHTASNWQVRQPVYSSAVERWRHYAGELGELQSLLDEGDSSGEQLA